MPSFRRRRLYSRSPVTIGLRSRRPAYPDAGLPHRRFACARFGTSPFDFHRTVSRDSAPALCVGLPSRGSPVDSHLLASVSCWSQPLIHARPSACAWMGEGVFAARSGDRASLAQYTSWAPHSRYVKTNGRNESASPPRVDVGQNSENYTIACSDSATQLTVRRVEQDL